MSVNSSIVTFSRPFWRIYSNHKYHWSTFTIVFEVILPSNLDQFLSQILFQPKFICILLNLDSSPDSFSLCSRGFFLYTIYTSALLPPRPYWGLLYLRIKINGVHLYDSDFYSNVYNYIFRTFIIHFRSLNILEY